MTAQELRKKYLEFFEKKGHSVIPSASLVPENDPTVLFTTAGMHPLIPYILGEKHPSGKRLVSVQKCIRTSDIEAVGDESHFTFFEMLGNWSLGDYGRKEAIEFSHEFLTKELNIDPKNLAITCFEGMPGVDSDQESKELWMKLGISEKRIKFLGKDDNFWGPPGIEGPCGPDTEMFVWTGGGEAPEVFDPENSSWLEVWNDVFMEFRKVLTEKGKEVLSSGGEFIEEEHFEYIPLEQKNVDTGMGLERMVSYLEGESDAYRTDVFFPIIEKIEAISGKKYEDNKKEFRIIADHIKAATFMIADGIEPSNKDRGYIVRRIIRRAVVKATSVGIKHNFVDQLARIIADIYTSAYSFDVDKVCNELEREESKFRQNLEHGLKIIQSQKEFTGKVLFDLYQSYGIPVETTIEEVKNLGQTISDATIGDFNKELKTHQELSRTASAGMFKGGLADDKGATAKLHTAAHLMLAALRRVLGDHVLQKGSNITSERLRFDFSHDEKMTPEQIKEVEDLVNEQIAKNVKVDMEEMSLEDAKTCGAMGVFEAKYGDKVKVYTIGPSTHSLMANRSGSDSSTSSEPPFSREICGGPHAENTGDLGHFKILKEESSSAGVRRIKAILE